MMILILALLPQPVRSNPQLLSILINNYLIYLTGRR